MTTSDIVDEWSETCDLIVETFGEARAAANGLSPTHVELLAAILVVGRQLSSIDEKLEDVDGRSIGRLAGERDRDDREVRP